jgi:protein dithiol oxidoreductase (disulfide-forming)
MNTSQAIHRRHIPWIALLMGLWTSVVALQASAAAPVAGRDYIRLEQVQPTSDPKKIVVTEFFSYQCPHCFSFSHPFAAWARTQPADVLVERVGISVGHPSWEPAARAWWVFNAMNMVAKFDDQLFDAIHVKRLNLGTEKDLSKWVGAQGGDAKQFSALYSSFGVDAQYRNAEAKSRSYRVPSIPAIAVDGRYLVAILDGTDFKPQLAVVSELIAMARKEKGGK